VIGAIVRPPLWASGRDSLGVMQILEDGKFQPAVAEPRPVDGARRLATWPGAKNDMRAVAWRCGQVMRWRGDGGEETEFAISRPWERGGSIVHRASGIVHRASCIVPDDRILDGDGTALLAVDTRPNNASRCRPGWPEIREDPSTIFHGEREVARRGGTLGTSSATGCWPRACMQNACRVRAERVFKIRQT
jgi:hypothetical protein